MIVTSFATLINSKVVSPSPRPHYLIVEKNFFQSCLRSTIEEVEVDEAWYLGRYPDVADAIKKKAVSSAQEHYATHGYFENRLPFRIVVDAPWYLKQYADVEQAVRSERFASAQDHFERVGFGEGRFPYPNFALVNS
jgi:hypothetical protein